MSGLVTTYQMRMPRGPHEDGLAAVAAHLCAVERHLHSALARLHRASAFDAEALRVGKNDLKRRFLTEHGITGRQYNSLLRGLEGRYASLQELAKARIETTERRRRSLVKKITARDRKLESFAKVSAAVEARAQLGKGPTKAQAKRLLSRDAYDKNRFIQHQQKRRAEILRKRIERDREIAATAVPPVVFGSKALLQQRAAIHPNDLDGLAAWRRKWERARTAQFLVIGSSDETAGCQSCVATANPDGRLSLALRLPDALRDEGAGRHLEITGLEFPEFGRDEIHKALQVHAAKGKDPEDRKERVSIAYRFVRDEDWPRGNPLSAWRLFVTLEVPAAEIPQPVFAIWGQGRKAQMAQGVEGNFCGALGVDLNADHLAWAVIDRHGNPVKAQTGRIDLPLRGKTSGQRAALIGDASAAVVSMAAELDLPIVIESLDFAARKRELEGSGAGYARMLSSLAYAAIQTMLRRRAARAGVELVEVNPAYTSVIGRVNYARRYGLSVHCAAAVAIARRAADLSERVNYVHGSRGHRNTLPTQSECRRHVWRQWVRVRKDLVARDSQSAKRHTAGAASSASSYCPQGHEGGDVRLRKHHAACPFRSRPDQGIQGALLTPGSDYIPYL